MSDSFESDSSVSSNSSRGNSPLRNKAAPVAAPAPVVATPPPPAAPLPGPAPASAPFQDDRRPTAAPAAPSAAAPAAAHVQPQPPRPQSPKRAQPPPAAPAATATTTTTTPPPPSAPPAATAPVVYAAREEEEASDDSAEYGPDVRRHPDGSTTRVLTADQFRALFQQNMARAHHFEPARPPTGHGAGAADGGHQVRSRPQSASRPSAQQRGASRHPPGFVDPYNRTKFKNRIVIPPSPERHHQQQQQQHAAKKGAKTTQRLRAAVQQQHQQPPHGTSNYLGDGSRGGDERLEVALQSLNALKHEALEKDRRIEELKVEVRKAREAVAKSEHRLLKNRPDHEALAVQGIIDALKTKNAALEAQLATQLEETHRIKQSARACKIGEVTTQCAAYLAEVRRLSDVVNTMNAAAREGSEGVQLQEAHQMARQKDAQIAALHDRLQMLRDELRRSEHEAARWKNTYENEKDEITRHRQVVEDLKAAPGEILRLKSELEMAERAEREAREELRKVEAVYGSRLDSAMRDAAQRQQGSQGAVEAAARERDQLVAQLREMQAQSEASRADYERRAAQLDSEVKRLAEERVGRERALAADREAHLQREKTALAARVAELEATLGELGERHKKDLDDMRAREQQRQEQMVATMGKFERERQAEMHRGIQDRERALQEQRENFEAERARWEADLARRREELEQARRTQPAPQQQLAPQPPQQSQPPVAAVGVEPQQLLGPARHIPTPQSDSTAATDGSPVPLPPARVQQQAQPQQQPQPVAAPPPKQPAPPPPPQAPTASPPPASVGPSHGLLREALPSSGARNNAAITDTSTVSSSIDNGPAPAPLAPTPSTLARTEGHGGNRTPVDLPIRKEPSLQQQQQGDRYGGHDPTSMSDVTYQRDDDGQSLHSSVNIDDAIRQVDSDEVPDANAATTKPLQQAAPAPSAAKVPVPVAVPIVPKPVVPVHPQPVLAPAPAPAPAAAPAPVSAVTPAPATPVTPPAAAAHPVAPAIVAPPQPAPAKAEAAPVAAEVVPPAVAASAVPAPAPPMPPAESAPVAPQPTKAAPAPPVRPTTAAAADDDDDEVSTASDEEGSDEESDAEGDEITSSTGSPASPPPANPAAVRGAAVAAPTAPAAKLAVKAAPPAPVPPAPAKPEANDDDEPVEDFESSSSSDAEEIPEEEDKSSFNLNDTNTNTKDETLGDFTED